MDGFEVEAEQARALIARIFVGAGMPDDTARTVAKVLVWADLGGIGSHGASRVEPYLEFIRRGALDPAAEPVVSMDGGALFQIEGKRAAGSLATSLGVGIAIEKARQHGMAFGLIANTTHIGAAGYYAEALAAEGLVGIVFTSGVPAMAYHGAAVPSLSTAPISIAAPAGRHPPLLLDMATSVGSVGRIREALAGGQSIPRGWAVTADGRPTTDPALAELLLPLGGAKGSGLALAFEAIASVLAGAPALAGILLGGPRLHRQNATVIAIDIARFRPLEAFRADIDQLIDALKSLPRMDGVEAILMPGERSQARRQAAERDGFTLRASLWSKLTALAEGSPAA